MTTRQEVEGLAKELWDEHKYPMGTLWRTLHTDTRRRWRQLARYVLAHFARKAGK